MFEKFSNQLLWELNEIENTRKINVLSKKRFFKKMLLQYPLPSNMLSLWIIYDTT